MNKINKTYLFVFAALAALVLAGSQTHQQAGARCHGIYADAGSSASWSRVC